MQHSMCIQYVLQHIHQSSKPEWAKVPPLTKINHIQYVLEHTILSGRDEWAKVPPLTKNQLRFLLKTKYFP